MAMPLIFVGKEETDDDYASLDHPDRRSRPRTRPPSGRAPSVKRATVPLLGQKVAFAESADAGRHGLRGADADLRGRGAGPGRSTTTLGPKKVRFFPVVRKAEIDVPSLQRIAGTSAAAGVVYQHDYLVHAFAGARTRTPGQVFLAGRPGGVRSSGWRSAPRATAPAASSRPTCS